METVLDARVIELICSRLCHDLVSPVGAIGNGVELIEEMAEEGGAAGTGMLDDAIGLIAHSAGQAARRLRLFRFAYGMAGSTAADFTEARVAAEGWLSGGKVTLDWTPGRPDPALAGRPGAMKMLLNLIVLADEALPYGGSVTVIGTGTADRGTLAVEASGRAARLLPETAAALGQVKDPADLSPRGIHAYATRLFADYYGMRLTVDPMASDRLACRLDWPGG